jgi:hypothetical protein
MKLGIHTVYQGIEFVEHYLLRFFYININEIL